MTALPLYALVAALAMSSPGEELERGRNAFLRGEYERAISVLHPLVYPDLRLDSENDVIQVHRMLGVAYLFENHPAEARGEFRKLLELAPDFRFDPLLNPPRVVEFFNEVVRAQRAELGDIEARLKRIEAEQSRHDGEILERRVERRSYVLNFVPFGAGQFQNGQRKKGWMFLGIEGTLAATSIAAFATNFALYGVRPERHCLDDVMPQPSGASGICPANRIDRSDENLSRNLTRLQVVTGALFFATAIWGAVDAVRGFQDSVVIEETYVPRPTGPARGGASSSAPRPASPPVSLRLLPTVTPVAQGASLLVTF